MTILPLIAAAIFGVLGLMHFAYTLRDLSGRPRYFRPTEPSVLAAMQASRTAIAPDAPDYWRGVLGFHLSHSIGVLLLALLIVVATLYLITWLKPILVIVGAAYAVVSYMCWFNAPTIGILLATTLMAAGWMV
jgi:fermentation-respiration switch protein FrsA (DUF1100 family)